MNTNNDLALLNELTYESRNLLIVFQREQLKLKKIYGNKWLLCTNDGGRINILKSCDNREELEELGFKLSGNKLFDVLNPAKYTNYKNHYSTTH